MHTMPLSAPIENFALPVSRAPKAETLTNRTVQPDLDAIGDGLAAARACSRTDQRQNGEHGAYAVATLYHALYLDQALDHFTDLNDWLAEHNGTEPGQDASLAPYQIHTDLREMVLALHYARHWAMLSASYHRSSAARDSFDHITRAIHRAETLSEQAGRAFLAASTK